MSRDESPGLVGSPQWCQRFCVTMDESTHNSKGGGRPVMAYRPGRDDRRRVALKDSVIASFYICIVALLLFFLVVVLVGEWLVGAQGPSVLDLVLIGGSCVLFALVAVIAVRRRLWGRPVQPLAA